VSPLHPAREMTETNLPVVEFENGFSIELEDFVTCTSCTLPEIRPFRSHFAGRDGSYQTVPLGLCIFSGHAYFPHESNDPAHHSIVILASGPTHISDPRVRKLADGSLKPKKERLGLVNRFV